MPGTEQSVICFIFHIPKCDGTITIKKNSDNTIIILGFSLILVLDLFVFVFVLKLRI